MKKVAILGASGYTGVELMRLTACHPRIELVAVSSEKCAGMPVGDVFPAFSGVLDLHFNHLSEQGKLNAADFVFLALPHQESMGVVPGLIDQGKRVIDLSADFRFRNPDTYEKWYRSHSAPELLSVAVYGLTEIYRERIEGAQLVANPGCYPTAVLLALIPAIKNGLINRGPVIVDAKSGVSGSGRSPLLASLFPEVNEGVKAYKVGAHQHAPEIEQELEAVAAREVPLLFTPHLIPMNRGILVTAYATLNEPVSTEEVRALYKTFYRDDVFVRICPVNTFPSTHQVRGSNYCDIGIAVDAGTSRLIMIAAIDNLVKGASGQAIQNMNIMAGFEETAGIGHLPLSP